VEDNTYSVFARLSVTHQAALLHLKHSIVQQRFQTLQAHMHGKRQFLSLTNWVGNANNTIKNGQK
jgi:hypothetical protein